MSMQTLTRDVDAGNSDAIMIYLVCGYNSPGRVFCHYFFRKIMRINMFIPSTPLFHSLQNRSATFRQLGIRETLVC